MNVKSHIPIISLLLLALAGALILWFATVLGIELKPDTGKYIMFARDLMRGHSLSNIEIAEPPLYPAILALMGKAGMDLFQAARWFNIFIFGSNIFLVGLIVRNYTKSLSASLVAGFLFATSVHILRTHWAAMTDALFIFMFLCSVVCLDSYLRDLSLRKLIVSAVAVALACLVRLVGIPLVLTGFVVIIYGSPRSLRALHFLAFAFISLFPVGIWLLWGLSLTHRIGGMMIHFHPITHHHLSTASEAFSLWLLNWSIPPMAAFILYGIWLLTLIIAQRNVQQKSYNQKGLLVFALFIIFYLVFLIISMLWIMANVFFGDVRYLAPVYVSLLIITVVMVHGFYQEFKSARGIITVLSGIILICYISAAACWVLASHQQGLGFASRAWKQSVLMQKVRTMPLTEKIYTNGKTPIYLLTGRLKNTFALPYEMDRISLEENLVYAAQIKSIREQIRQGRAIVVYFSKMKQKTYVATEDELKKQLSLYPIYQCQDGTIYGPAGSMSSAH